MSTNKAIIKETVIYVSPALNEEMVVDIFVDGSYKAFWRTLEKSAKALSENVDNGTADEIRGCVGLL